MRLTKEQQLNIKKIIYQADPQCECYLFGSRTNDFAKGGDIDLLVLSTKINLIIKLDILAKLHLCLGMRKIDLVIYPDCTHSFTKLIMQTGVRL